MRWSRWRESKKWNDGKWILEIGWMGNWTMKGSNLSAHRGLKKMIILRLKVCCKWLFDYLFIVLSFWDCCVTMCWIGLCIWFGLEFAIFTSANILKFCGTNDSGWLRFKAGSCGAVGNVFVLFCDLSYVFGVIDIFVFYSFICASKSILFMDVENIPKNPAKSLRATLACLFTCVCIAHVL